jgi:hypothetical protein
MNNEPEDGDMELSGGRGQAYPGISLEKAIERITTIRDAGFARTALPDAGVFKLLGFKGPSGPSRRVLAALNYYGLTEYIGKGKDRKIKLTDLALRILLDKVPDSPARAAAIKEAARRPEIFQQLLETFPYGMGTDAGIITYLTLTCEYLDEPAKLLLAVFRDTLNYAGLDKPDNVPLEEVQYQEVNPMTPQNQVSTLPPPPTIDALALQQASGDNDMKVLLDGNRLRVSAYVDLKGARKLLKRLQMNIDLLEAEDDADEMPD